MGISRGPASTLAPAGSSAVNTTTWGMNPSAGSKVLVFVSADTVTAPSSVEDNGTSQSVFTLDKGETSSGGGGCGAWVYRADEISLPASGQYAVTVTFASAVAQDCGGVAYTGVAVGGPAATSGGTAVSSAVSAGTVTPGGSQSLYFGAFNDSSYNTETVTLNWAAGTGQFTETNGTNYVIGAAADAITSGAQTPAWTISESTVTWVAAAAAYNAAAAGSLVVTASNSGAGAENGIGLAVVVVTNQAASPLGATASSVTLTVPQLAVTPQGTGSVVYGCLINGNASAAFTFNAATTSVQNYPLTGLNTTLAAFSSAAFTAAGTPVTLGATAPSEPSTLLLISMLEILPAGGDLVTDGSTPAPAGTLTALSVSTAAFTPPAGSLLVALVTADITGILNANSSLSVSDSYGYTWTLDALASYVAGSGIQQAGGIFTALVTPPPLPAGVTGGPAILGGPLLVQGTQP